MPTIRSSRRVKKNRFYSTTTAAEAIGGKRQTIQVWIWRHGLKTVDGFRPHMIRGQDLIAFMAAKKAARKQQCGPGDFFCFGCKALRPAAFQEVELIRQFPRGGGTLRALCAQCTCIMHRLVSRDQLVEFARVCSVTIRIDL